MNTFLRTLTCTLCILSLYSTAVLARNSNMEYDLGISAGILFPGSISAESDLDDDADTFDETLNTKSGLFLRAIADMFVTPNFTFGGFIHYSPIRLKESKDLGYWDGRSHTIDSGGMHMFEFGGAFKLRIPLADNIMIKPGMGVGYRRIVSDNEDARMKGLGINGSLEIQYRTNESYYVYADLGFIAQPYGGVQDVAYMMFGPIMYAALGLGF